MTSLIRPQSISNEIMKKARMEVPFKYKDYCCETCEVNLEMPLQSNKKIDLLSVVPNQQMLVKKSNQQTQAYRFFEAYQLEENDAKVVDGDKKDYNNFSSKYYLNSDFIERNKGLDLDKNTLDDKIKILKTLQKNAKVRAEENSKQFQQGEREKKVQLENNQEKIKKRVNLKITNDNNQQREEYKKQKAEIKKLYQAMEQVVEHILSAQGEQKFDRLNQKLIQKENLCVEALRECKITDPREALDNLGSLRLLVSKKTDEYELLRDIESTLKLDQNSEFISDLRSLSESGLNSSAGSSKLNSRLSRFTEEVIRQKEKEEERKISKYFNLKELMVKWNLKDINEVKKTIRRALVRETLAEHERLQAKNQGSYQTNKDKKVEELKIMNGISQLAVTKVQIREAQKQATAQGILQKPRLVSQQTDPYESIHKEAKHEQQEQIKDSKAELSKSMVSEISQPVNVKNKKKIDKKQTQKMIENQTKKKFFQSNEYEQGKFEVLKRTLDYANIFQQKVQNYS